MLKLDFCAENRKQEISAYNKESYGINYWGFDMKDGGEMGWTVLLRQGVAHQL